MESVNNSMAGAMNWDEMIKELRDEGLEALPEEDEAVLRRVLNVALRFEPTERATAEEIVGMFPRQWETPFIMGG
jgi:2-iminoacetate synthase ThiH